MKRMTRRSDFIAAARGYSVAMPGLILQGRVRSDDAPPRLGFTCSKKLGNAVVRNRSKRRLREAARVEMPGAAAAGYDYVVIGRIGTAQRNFTDLLADLRTAVRRLHDKARPSSA